MSLFKKKESSFEDMDSQSQLKRIAEQLGFLEKKVDTLIEELRSRGGSSRPSFGGHSQSGPRNFSRDRQERGGFRGAPNNRPRPEGGSGGSGGNTRYAGQGPRRYNSARPYGNDDNRGNFGGGGRPEGLRGNHRPNQNRRPQQFNSAPSAPPAAQQENQPTE